MLLAWGINVTQTHPFPILIPPTSTPGTEQIHDQFGDQTKIVMESQNKYKKEYQPRFPQAPEDWFPETEKEKEIGKRDKKKKKKHERGHKRWKTLPQPIDVSGQEIVAFAWLQFADELSTVLLIIKFI